MRLRARVTFLLEIDGPNEPVHVEAPADAVPSKPSS
jgi:hypothetical protein